LKNLVDATDQIKGSKGNPTTGVDLCRTKHSKVIIFVVKKCMAQDLANQLWEDEFTVDSLHGIRRGRNKQK
jgi:hypothetical protein